MKTIYSFLLVLAVPIILLLISFTSGPNGGYTGSPSDAKTCTDCHTTNPTPVPADEWITTNIPVSGYVPGTKYTVTATGTDIAAQKFGFQITCEDGSNAKSGTFVITDPERTKIAGGGDGWVTHTSDGTVITGIGNTWSMDWIAPAEGTGTVTFYAAFNAADGDGTNNGDLIYTSSTSVGEFHVGIDEKLLAESITVYPNPATNYLNIDLPGTSQLKIYDMSGRQILDMQTDNNTERVDVSGLQNGLYIAKINYDGAQVSKRFMKR